MVNYDPRILSIRMCPRVAGSLDQRGEFHSGDLAWHLQFKDRSLV